MIGDYKLASCAKCGSVGTIVQLGACCRIDALAKLAGIIGRNTADKFLRETAKRRGDDSPQSTETSK